MPGAAVWSWHPKVVWCVRVVWHSQAVRHPQVVWCSRVVWHPQVVWCSHGVWHCHVVWLSQAEWSQPAAWHWPGRLWRAARPHQAANRRAQQTRAWELTARGTLGVWPRPAS
ncbi:hypothetical protein Abr02nite_45550 [Paractinoplanes brasiliensis]|nr:hypothetical protein Abr02nite_45550 [Actinoplanes brasiliensis]